MPCPTDRSTSGINRRLSAGLGGKRRRNKANRGGSRAAWPRDAGASGSDRERAKRVELHGRASPTTNAVVKNIYCSDGWKILMAYYRLRNEVHQKGTRTRAAAQILWGILFDGTIM